MHASCGSVEIVGSRPAERTHGGRLRGRPEVEDDDAGHDDILSSPSDPMATHPCIYDPEVEDDDARPGCLMQRTTPAGARQRIETEQVGVGGAAWAFRASSDRVDRPDVRGRGIHFELSPLTGRGPSQVQVHVHAMGPAKRNVRGRTRACSNAGRVGFGVRRAPFWRVVGRRPVSSTATSRRERVQFRGGVRAGRVHA